jgi:hypothetical protein
MVDSTDEIASEKAHCFDSIARRMWTKHTVLYTSYLGSTHLRSAVAFELSDVYPSWRTGRPERTDGKSDAAFLSSRKDSEENLVPWPTLMRLPGRFGGRIDDVRACPMEIMMISSKCQIAPYGMLKLFMRWPFCVVLIKPWRWSHLVDLMGSEECISDITSVEPPN